MSKDFDRSIKTPTVWLMAGSGIKELFEMIYAPKAVEQIMSGKAISTVVSAHLMLDAATVQIDGCTTA